MYHSWARSGEKIAETAQTDTRAASASARPCKVWFIEIYRQRSKCWKFNSPRHVVACSPNGWSFPLHFRYTLVSLQQWNFTIFNCLRMKRIECFSRARQDFRITLVGSRHPISKVRLKYHHWPNIRIPKQMRWQSTAPRTAIDSL